MSLFCTCSQCGKGINYRLSIDSGPYVCYECARIIADDLIDKQELASTGRGDFRAGIIATIVMVIVGCAVLVWIAASRNPGQ